MNRKPSSCKCLVCANARNHRAAARRDPLWIALLLGGYVLLAVVALQLVDRALGSAREYPGALRSGEAQPTERMQADPGAVDGIMLLGHDRDLARR